MENIAISLVLAQFILIPLAIKWELNLRTVFFGGIVIGLFVGLVINLGMFVTINLLLKLIINSVLIIVIAIITLLFRFYRDPKRIPLSETNVILAPADGKIKYIKHIEKGEIPISEKRSEKVQLTQPLLDILKDQEGYLIGIVMTFLDVHVIRALTSGRLTYFKHITGSFYSLKKEDSPYRNERVVEIIENGKIKIGLIQIASRLVRRIVAYVEKGDELNLGQKIGMIKFGSQVDILIPKLGNLKIKVSIGDQVYAGTSIIANH